jgi:integrase
VAKGRITKKSAEKVPVPVAGKRSYLWDDTLKGFGVMVTPKGTRCYLIQYKIGGRSGSTRRCSIGHHGNPWTAEKARDRAADLLELVRKGIDPMEAARDNAALAAERRKVEEELAFSAYADVFIKKHVEDRGLRSLKDIKGVFERDLKPFFRDKPITKIDRDDIHEMLDAVGDRSESAANKAHKWLRKFFNYAADKKSRYLKLSPMRGMPSPYDDGQRTRVLSDSEISIVWEATAKLPAPFRDLVRLLMLTGQRLREVARMDWSEINLEKREWIIPGSRTKNKHPHLVPLSPPVLALLASKTNRAGFVLTSDGKTAIGGFSKTKSNLDAEVSALLAARAADAGQPPSSESLQLEHWVYHDLRRTLATGCQSMKVPIEHTEAVLNHVSGKRSGVKGVYHLYDYQREKTAALLKWGRHVDKITQGKAS